MISTQNEMNFAPKGELLKEQAYSVAEQ